MDRGCPITVFFCKMAIPLSFESKNNVLSGYHLTKGICARACLINVVNNSFLMIIIFNSLIY